MSEPNAPPTGYRLPPPEIVRLVDAPRTPAATIDPRREWILLLDQPNLPPIAEIARPELRLAGLRIDPRTNGASQELYLTGLSLLRIADGTTRSIDGLAPDARVRHTSWSPDGSLIAFTVTVEEGIMLWVTEVESGMARQLTPPILNEAIHSPAYTWLPGSNGLICRTIVEDRGDPPQARLAPDGPIIHQSSGRAAPSRTYQDLLGSPHDELLFTYYTRSSLQRIGLDGERSGIGEPGIFTTVAPSPDGRWLFVEQIHPPYSYLVPCFRFPHSSEVWTIEGEHVRTLADLPLAEQVPISFDAVREGARSFSWRGDAPSTLCWVEAADGGDPDSAAEVRDIVRSLDSPFTGDPVVMASLENRYAGITWGNGSTALLSEYWWKTRRLRTWRFAPDDPSTGQAILFDRSWEDRYGDPGSPVMRRSSSGGLLMHITDDGQAIHLTGEGASPEGNRPFLDRLDLATGSTTRRFHSAAPYYEHPVTFLDSRGNYLLTRRESPQEPPNFFRHDLDSGAVTQLTFIEHPLPEFREIHKELIQYTRDDGVPLSATLYLPPGYTSEQGPLPLLMWAYPQEYKSSDAAGQLDDSPHRFAGIGWSGPLPLLTQGYAILDNPAMPIVGEGDIEPNDTYMEQLVAGARAAVEEMVRRGIADRARIAVGGHSYGAFMTANLLAHSNLFSAGIARSGAYNRTLTPFGFQIEQRTLWQAPEVYIHMSPFMSADRIRTPLLMIHGQTDNNQGTYPMQSERLYQAINGLGGTARLVLLPHESHSYRARESVLHMLWEMYEWMERYVARRGEDRSSDQTGTTANASAEQGHGRSPAHG